MKIKRYIQLSIVSALLSTPLPLLAGSLEPPSDPTSYSGYTIQDICNRLDSGTDGTQSTFQEPTAAPGSTGCTLDEVMGKAPVVDDTDGATPAEVATGKTFWGLRTDGTWGLQTGTKAAMLPCSGTANGTRWCDNGDGTVTDLSTGLVWLQKADWGGTKQWDGNGNDNAQVRAGTLKAADETWLTDSSEEGDWRLPTKKELVAITTGTEPVLSATMQAFTGVQSVNYWSSTTFATLTGYAWIVYLDDGYVGNANKTYTCYVWPVRGGV